MRRSLPLLVVVSCVALGLPGTPAHGTDLGKGNAEIKATFDAYVKGGHRVKPSDAERRVMITGFGLFSGVDFNISGVVVESMANPAFWPAKAKLDALPKPPAKTKVGAGTLAAKDGGARVWQRTLEIDGATYEVCFLVVDVLWDLGAAITLFEAEHFKPHLIVMTGRGGKTAVFEHGALNKAVTYSGFLSDGQPHAANTPIKPSVLDPKNAGVEPTIGMTWDNRRLADVARPIVTSMKKGYEVVAAPGARPKNTYICNNISCVVLHGLKGRKVSLAGGAIELETKGLAKTAAGFFHYPAAAANDPTEVQTWAHMLCAVVKAHFASIGAKKQPAAVAAEGTR